MIFEIIFFIFSLNSDSFIPLYYISVSIAYCYFMNQPRKPFLKIKLRFGGDILESRRNNKINNMSILFLAIL
jgi:hypothetical protein